MTTIALAILLPLLLAAAWGDMRARIITNRLNLAIALSAPLLWWALGLPLWPDVAARLFAATLVFALFAGLFVAGMMGGGDVKLAAAIALWLPWRAVPELLVLTALWGGVVSVATLIVHRLRAAEGAAQVPYGVAIVAAAFVCLGEHYLYQFP